MIRLLLLALLIITSVTTESKAQDIYGFNDANAVKQLELERNFDSMVDTNNLDAWLKEMSARPHAVGSEHGRSNVQFMLKLFKEWGYDAEIASYHILFPTPKTRELSIVGDPTYKPLLKEPSIPEDPFSGQEGQLPSYNAYSADGDVTGQLVYVNQGIPRDYEELARRGIDVKGKIVIARYGGSWRGIKPKVAAENGAIGCILYSDPIDDGYHRGLVYPEGPFKNEYGVQRGSVQDMPFYPGDPSTPNMASTKGVDRLPLDEISTLTKIPVFPISHKDALPLLQVLEGPVAPNYWKGALPLTYRTGPSTEQVHMKLEFNWDIVEAQNVIATLEGSEFPDDWIMRGNHHDAWVNGASDPVSGMVALMEEARIIGMLAKEGHRPKRTIKYAGWDAEEPGLIGSTEWAEEHATEIKEKMAVYINTDGSSRGFFGAGASHTLEKYINEVAREVMDPQFPITISERKKARTLVTGNAEAKAEARSRKDFRVYPLGSGSDYSPFLQHLGIASMNISFGGEGSGGEYHSIYDTYDHYTRFKDPGLVYLATLPKVAGRMTLRMANADILPFDFNGLYDNINMYASELMQSVNKMREATKEENDLIASGLYEQALDPNKKLSPPSQKDAVPHINFSDLENALDKFEKVSGNFQSELADQNKDLSETIVAQLNQVLKLSERLLTNEKGLPRRNWYKHKIYAPGFYTGYGVKTLPGIREAIEQRYWSEVESEMLVLTSTIDSLSESLNQATELLK